MSTLKIEEAVRKLGLESKDPRTDELVAAALEELAALRRAARMVENCGLKGDSLREELGASPEFVTNQLTIRRISQEPAPVESP